MIIDSTESASSSPDSIRSSDKSSPSPITILISFPVRKIHDFVDRIIGNLYSNYVVVLIILNLVLMIFNVWHFTIVCNYQKLHLPIFYWIIIFTHTHIFAHLLTVAIFLFVLECDHVWSTTTFSQISFLTDSSCCRITLNLRHNFLQCHSFLTGVAALIQHTCQFMLWV